MQAIIPVAGRANRLAVITDLPKCLLTINGQSLLTHTLNSALSLGCTSAILVVRGREVPDRLGEQYRGMPLSYIEQPEPQGLGHAVAQGLSEADETFVLLIGDVWRPGPFLTKTYDHFRQGDTPLVMVSPRPREVMTEYAAVVMEPDDGISRIEEKPAEPPSCWAEAGIYRFPRAIMEAPLNADPNHGITLQSMENWLIEQGWPLRAVRDATPWINVNTPEDLFQARSWAQQAEIPYGVNGAAYRSYGKDEPWPAF